MGGQNPVDSSLMNSNALRKREKKTLQSIYAFHRSLDRNMALIIDFKSFVFQTFRYTYSFKITNLDKERNDSV